MKKLRVCLICLLTLCCCEPAVAQTAEKNHSSSSVQAAPEAWLIKKGRELLDVLSVKETKSRYVKLRRLSKEVFNQSEMPRLAMGKYWKEMTSAQQEELQFLFFDYFVVEFGSFSMDFSNVSIHVTETVPSGKDVLLKTSVKMERKKASAPSSENKPQFFIEKAENSDSIEILFALRRTSGGYYIRDAKFEGQSILMFLRSKLEKEYRSVDFEAADLLEKMRVKINSRYRAAEELAKAKGEKRQ